MIATEHSDDSGVQEVVQILKGIAPFAAFVWSATFAWTATANWFWVVGSAPLAMGLVAATLFGEPSVVRQSWVAFAKCTLAFVLVGVCIMLLYAGVIALIALIKAVVAFLLYHIVFIVLALFVAGWMASVLNPNSTVTGNPNGRSSSGWGSGQSGGYRTHPDSGRRWLYKHERIALWKDAGKQCYHCGKKLASSSPKSMHVDHLVPFSLGGSCDDGNLVASCSRCNLRKGNREDFDPSEPRKRKRRRKT